ncbi:MAG: NADH-quinone oxidoreductase subunit K [Phycisphaeraceae bacterium]|nr:NADH-quinone oxidoreductase subunit K [Phycisphaeraceae bacterium]
MIWALAMAIWVTLLVGARLAMSRDLVRCVLGLAIVASGVNLVLFASGRVTTALPAVIPSGSETVEASANPLPQALVLTAIVIGFALICFALVAALRLIDGSGSDNAADLVYAEPRPTDPVVPPYDAPEFDPPSPEVEPTGHRSPDGAREPHGRVHA